jgi:hypothetical protein
MDLVPLVSASDNSFALLMSNVNNNNSLSEPKRLTGAIERLTLVLYRTRVFG